MKRGNKIATYASSRIANALEHINLSLEIGNRRDGKLEVEGMARSRDLLQNQILKVEKIASWGELKEDGFLLIESDGELNKLRLITHNFREPQIDIDFMRLGVHSSVMRILQTKNALT